MAIYSLHHAPIGRSTQARPHTAAAHVGYITRRSAMSRYETARMPPGPRKAAAYLQRMEDGDRANARVADKVRLALPRELNADQRANLVRGFAEDVTRGRAPWLAAFHDRGKDAHNPHCHLLIRDRDPDTGRRVIGLSDAGSTDRLRETWERHANLALEAAGHAERIDRRTLQAQGVARAPTIHEGPRAQGMAKRGARPTSRPVNRRNRPGSRQTSRLVNYPAIDGGRSRPDYNAAIRAAGREPEAELWAAIDADTARREFVERGYGADLARMERLQEGRDMARRPSHALMLDTPEGEHARIAHEKQQDAAPSVSQRPDDLQRERIGALERHLSPNEHEAALRAGLARKEAEQAQRTGLDGLQTSFFQDKTRPINTGPDAPRIKTYEASGLSPSTLEYDRPQTPQEQQTMTWREALNKRIGEPVLRAAQRLQDAEDRFYHDPAKVVKTGPDAPKIGRSGDLGGSRPATAREQQRMGLGEALFKRFVKPAFTGQKFQGGDPPAQDQKAIDHDRERDRIQGRPIEPARGQVPAVEQAKPAPRVAESQVRPVALAASNPGQSEERAARKERLMEQMREQEQARKLDKTKTRSR